MQSTRAKFQTLEKSDRQMIQSAISLSFVFIGLLILFPSLSHQKALGPVLGYIQSNGKVKRATGQAGQWSYLSDGDYFYPGDVLSTPPGVRSTLVYDGGSQVEVFPQTLVAVETSVQGQPQVVVYEGKARGRGIHITPRDVANPASPPEAIIASPGLVGLPSALRHRKRP